MTALRVKHIADALEARFGGLIDMSDAAPDGSEQRAKEFRTRALAAQALMRVAGIDVTTAAAAVTDGTNDNGIDGIYIDQEDAVVLVQRSGIGTERRGSGWVIHVTSLRVCAT